MKTPFPAPTLSPQTTPAAFPIVLIGVEFEENLSLRYLAGALLAAGYAATRVQPYNSVLEAEAICEAIMAENPALVGISMVFQARAIEDLTLIELLRRRGYAGHITVGGQFATLDYADVFLDAPGLSSLVRFEAEATAVQLADTLRTGATLADVPGLVWRDAAGAVQVNHAMPAPGDLNALPWPLRKPERREYLGLKTAHLIGSRGCHATCQYCCVAALATERNAAARAAGGSALPGTRRRTPTSVADEMAALYHDYGVRIFEFQDDNWIPPKTDAAVAYFTELHHALTARQVGQIGLTLKMRADAAQPEILRILKAIGLIRVFVGIESGTQELLDKLGRRTRVENASLRALRTLRDFQIPAYFNALLFGPDIRFEEIEPELQFLENGLDFPFEITEVVIYGKTGLYLSLNLEKRLHGNYLAYDYDYLDAATQRTHALVSQLETRHFGVYAPVKMAADLGFNLGVLQVFYPGPHVKALADRVAALNHRINADQLRVVRQAAAIGASDAPLGPARQALQADTVARDLNFYREIIELQQQAEQLARVHAPTAKAYYRTGGVLQSGLIAGLFLLTMGSAVGQELPPQVPDPNYSPELSAQVDRLRLHFDAKEWRRVKAEIAKIETPITYAIRSSIKEGAPEGSKKKKDRHRIYKELEILRVKRVREDYERLNALLREHQPKIRIANSLILWNDDKGRILDVEVIASGEPRKQTFKNSLRRYFRPSGVQVELRRSVNYPLGLHDTILAVLQRHQFKLREFSYPDVESHDFLPASKNPLHYAQSTISKSGKPRSRVSASVRMRYYRIRRKLGRLLFPLPRRRGPMD